MDNHPSSTPPAKTKYTGCFIAIALVVALAIAGVTIAYSFFVIKKSDTRMEAESIHETAMETHESQMMGIHGNSKYEVMIQKSEASSYSPQEFGDALSAKHFVAVAASEGITSLAEKRFAEKANGQRVEWMLKVDDLTADGESKNVQARFSLPYSFQTTHGSTGSSYRIRAEFLSGSVDGLINLRKGDWVKVAGNLKFSPGNNTINFENAELVQETEKTVQ